jgi:hypothetical protein
VGGEIFRTCPDRPWSPPSPLYNGYRVFLGGKERPGRDADPSLSSSAVVMKEYSYTSNPIMGRTVSTEPHCLYKGALYLYLLLRKFLEPNRRFVQKMDSDVRDCLSVPVHRAHYCTPQTSFWNSASLLLNCYRWFSFRC